MTTTAQNITNHQIKALLDEALDAGDEEMAAIATVALGGLLTPEQAPIASHWDAVSARSECAEVIAGAEAMDDGDEDAGW